VGGMWVDWGVAVGGGDLAGGPDLERGQVKSSKRARP